MGIDYRIKVYRKQDDKQIAEFYCNQFKNILGVGTYESDDFIHFTENDINDCIAKIRSKMEDKNKEIEEKTNMIPKCVSVDVKREIEDDIRYLKEGQTELEYALNSCYIILGMMHCIVEDNIRDFNDEEKEKPAYEYNSDGLPKTKEGYEPTIWMSGVYFDLEPRY